MRNINTAFEDFESEKLTKKQQKTIHGGDGEDPNEPKEPGKGGGGNGNG